MYEKHIFPAESSLLSFPESDQQRRWRIVRKSYSAVYTAAL